MSHSDEDEGVRRRQSLPAASSFSPKNNNNNHSTSSPSQRPRLKVPVASPPSASKRPGPAELDAMMNVFFKSGQQSSRLYKLIVIGDVDTGKSAIIRRYVHNFFTDNYRSTVGVDFHLKIVPYNEEMEIRLQLWDIAGQERFSHMTRAYFKGAMGALIIFDYSNAESFKSVERWKSDIDKKCFLPDGKRIPTILLANKTDLGRDRDLPDDLALAQFVQEKGFVPKWYKTSAKTGEGIDDAMRVMVKYIMAMDTWNKPLSNPDEDDTYLRLQNTLKLKEEEEREKKEKELAQRRCAC